MSANLPWGFFRYQDMDKPRFFSRGWARKAVGLMNNAADFLISWQEFEAFSQCCMNRFD